METILSRPRNFARICALTLAALGATLVHVPSYAQIYLCVGASGTRELTDRYKPGCKALEVASSYPAPSGAPKRAGGGSGERRASPPATTPADFPRVASSQQKERDDDRRSILQNELQAELRKLTDLRAEYKNGEPDRLGNEKNYAKYQERVAAMRDSIARSEKDIEALQREIANIK